MDRPVGVTIIAILVAINGALAFIGAVGAFLVGAALEGFVALLFALILLYLAWGLWTLRQWAWLGTLVITGLNALFAVFAVFADPAAIGAWISLIVAAVIIYYLTRPDVRAAFGRRVGA